MPGIRKGLVYFRKYGLNSPTIYLFSFMILFWALFDGIMSYLAPVIIVQNGLSEVLMGIILGTSSVAGALFDFIICRVFKSVNYRRVFIVMFAASAIFPLVLFAAKSFFVYVIAMALWGFYYDLKNFGSFDYVGRFIGKKEHSSSFGVIEVFLSAGYLVAPLIAGFLIGQKTGWKPFIMGWIFLAISVIFFITLIILKRGDKDSFSEMKRKLNVFTEFDIWKKIGKVLLPVMMLIVFMNILDSFFWTIGPLFSQKLISLQKFGSLFMVAYVLPSLLVGWFAGPVNAKFGKKRTAFFGLLTGSLLLSFFYFVNIPLLAILNVFIASIFISMAWPSIDGAFADYISESSTYEREIEGLEDFSTNAGYVIGPVLAGFFAQAFTNAGAFSIVGIMGIIVSLLLIKFTPRKINLSDAGKRRR